MVFKNKRLKASLTIEFTLMIPVVMSLFLTLTFLIFTHQIQVKIEKSMSEAMLEITDDIYISSIMNEKTNIGDIFTAISNLSEDLLGIKINLGKKVTEEILKNKIRELTYKKMNLDTSSPPFWFTKDFDFTISTSDNSIYISSVAEIKLPVISKIFGNIRIRQKAVQAARGVESFGSMEISSVKSEKDTKKIVITAYSLNGKNSNPVYHDKQCFGRINEKTQTSSNLEIDLKDIGDNGEIFYNGKVFHYCSFCKNNKNLKKVERE